MSFEKDYPFYYKTIADYLEEGKEFTLKDLRTWFKITVSGNAAGFYEKYFNQLSAYCDFEPIGYDKFRINKIYDDMTEEMDWSMSIYFFCVYSKNTIPFCTLNEKNEQVPLNDIETEYLYKLFKKISSGRMNIATEIKRKDEIIKKYIPNLTPFQSARMSLITCESLHKHAKVLQKYFLDRMGRPLSKWF